MIYNLVDKYLKKNKDRLLKVKDKSEVKIQKKPSKKDCVIF